MEAADVVRIGPEAFRRNIGLQTGSRTISMGFQIVLPGESAPAHRHTNTALRFVVEGRKFGVSRVIYRHGIFTWRQGMLVSEEKVFYAEKVKSQMF